MSPPTNSQPRPAPVRSSRKAEMSESTKSELLRRARHAFAEFGFADAPIEALVASAGMSKGALYHHFGSKQGLFLAVVRELSQDIGGVFPVALKPSRHGLDYS